MAYLTLTDWVALLIGIAVLTIWLYFYFAGKKYENMFAHLDPGDYPMGDTYFVGYAVLKLLKVQFKGKKARKLRKELTVVYEPKYVDYYLRVIYSMQYTMALTIACFAAPMYFLTDSVLLVMMLAGAVGVYYYYGTVMEEKIKKRSDEILSDFSEVVSKLALLVNSGMILNEAWRKVAFSGTGNDNKVLYLEMRRSVNEMANGKSAADALYEFGQRSMLPEITIMNLYRR